MSLGMLFQTSGMCLRAEQTDWDEVNRLLKLHGFKPVHLTKITEYQDGFVLDKKCNTEITSILKTVLKNTERQEKLIQELIQSNIQLKNEVQQQMNRAARQSQRASELEKMQDGVKAKIQDLEDSYIAKAAEHQKTVQQLQREKSEAQKHCEHLEEKLSENGNVISQLQKQLNVGLNEEDKRIARQNRIFEQFHKRAARSHSVTDQQLLDVIDAYESKIHHQQVELSKWMEKAGGINERVEYEISSTIYNEGNKKLADGTSSYKTILKSYQDQLTECKAQKEQLKQENLSLKKDLQSRPTVTELKLCKQQLKRLERHITQSNIRPKENKKGENKKIFENNEYLLETEYPIILKELGIQDLNDLTQFTKLQRQQLENYKQLVKVLNGIKAIVYRNGVPFELQKESYLQAVENADYGDLLPTIELWAEQLAGLKELQHALQKLLVRLDPYNSIKRIFDENDGVKVEELQHTVEMMLQVTEEDEINSNVIGKPSQPTLLAIVSHFQKLFDVKSISGVYPRMNEVYTKLGEMTNTMRNLRQFFDLDDSASPSTLVHLVEKLCCLLSDRTVHQVHQLLGTLDIESIIRKLQEHEEFFPAFHDLIQELLHVLGVHHLDDILPTVMSLKRLTE
ncbi:centrosomal protein of 70 kDa isoform X1 [Erpetoichthys calabaricus]|nr:centrosomal protein of 70 kDa isoform X1 [Erpetoichthys calabaricus]XP_051786515.1 centrosomal protein of 70 kDa isoform X1 [Erpetoichthys calabaricus]